MNNAEYTDIVETLYAKIEEILDDLIEAQQAPIDYENSSGVITIDCEDTDTKVIISKQQASQQIWVAAKSGGFHCNHESDTHVWRCTKTQESLEALLNRVCTEQSHQAITFPGVDAVTV
jgi:CyaY protein